MMTSIGSQFVACGKDTAVRVYDEATKTAIVTMRGGMGYSNKVTSGHSNRVFAAKFNPSDENLIVTGGMSSALYQLLFPGAHCVLCKL